MCNTARRLSRGRRGRVVVSVVSFFVKNDYACAHAHVHSHSHTLTRAQLRGGSRPEGQQRVRSRQPGCPGGPGCAGRPRSGLGLLPPLRLCPSIVRPSSAHPLSTPAAHSPHAPNGPIQGFAFAAPLRGAGEKGALPLIPPTPAGFFLPLLRSLLKEGSPPGKRLLPPGLSPSQECEPRKSRVSVSACCDLCP